MTYESFQYQRGHIVIDKCKHGLHAFTIGAREVKCFNCGKRPSDEEWTVLLKHYPSLKKPK